MTDLKGLWLPPRQGIYAITHNASGKTYIGSSKNCQLRTHDHLKGLRKGNHCNVILQAAWNKYGSDAFSFDLVEVVDDIGQILNREEFWIRALRSHCDFGGFNICPTPSRPSRAVVHTLEARKKMAVTRGRKRSQAECDAISRGHKGRIKSPQHCQRLSAAKSLSGRAWSPEGTEYQFTSLRTFCKEHGLMRCSMSKVASGNSRYKHHHGWRCEYTGRSVVRLPKWRITHADGRIWFVDNMSNFAKEHGLSPSGLSGTLVGKKCRGYVLELNGPPDQQAAD